MRKRRLRKKRYDDLFFILNNWIIKCPSHPHRRRSLFGPGCLSFEFTLQAKEINDNDDDNEKKMEVDDGEKEEVLHSSILIVDLSLLDVILYEICRQLNSVTTYSGRQTQYMVWYKKFGTV